ncbi:hypothetical protein [Bacillus sp. FSL K6-3431]|uniref:hypothetical protein n=1 Tax=Bacillus sp. FSL K6-3431 TaxID=2921500 RepID=UPI0040469F7E
MSFFQDTLSIFKKRDLLFLESYKESEDVYTFLFEKEKDLTYSVFIPINNPIPPYINPSIPFCLFSNFSSL